MAGCYKTMSLSSNLSYMWKKIYIFIRVCDSSSGLHGPLIANPSGCLKTMWASHVTSRVKVCLYNEIRTHQPILFPHRFPAGVSGCHFVNGYDLQTDLTPADLTWPINIPCFHRPASGSGSETSKHLWILKGRCGVGAGEGGGCPPLFQCHDWHAVKKCFGNILLWWKSDRWWGSLISNAALIYLAVMTCNNKIGGALFEDFYVIWCHIMSTLLPSLYPCVTGFG